MVTKCLALDVNLGLAELLSSLERRTRRKTARQLTPKGG